ncbi:hypothetical protein RGQ29_013380 [Quercus rubra]|uniref:CCHC-type domain-containing protein n=1 Tax=Quercus rubra TaxID=3512 RepID=A0AAN7G890_QUERU|nr:hypothetical protein RGQ29_013380 [Quercus rubra]
MSKPLVTNVRIGQRCQHVVYEGVDQLCFDCGRLGHWREVCPFTIKPFSSEGPRDTSAADSDVRGNHKPTSPMAQPVATPENQDTSEEESSGAAFNPWVVVSRKRKDSSLGNKSCSNHVAHLRSVTGHVMAKETLGSRSLNIKDGPNLISKNESKRKAHLDSGLNMVSKEQVIVKKDLSTSLGRDGLGSQGRFSYGSANGKPNSNSVKGKKEVARSRNLHVNSLQLGRTKENNRSNTKWSLSIYSIQADQNGGFKFGASAGKEASDHYGQRACGESKSDYGGVGSSSHSRHDSLQAVPPMGMEDIRIGIKENGRQRLDEKDEGVQLDGCVLAMCVIKDGQRLAEGSGFDLSA